MAYHQSEAYDLSLFEERAPKVQQKEQRQTLRVITTKQSQKTGVRRAAATKIVCCVLLFVAWVTCSLYARAQLNQLNEDILAQTTLLNTLQGENTRLQTELEGKISLRDIELYASINLGMSQIDQEQITYLTQNQGDRVEVYGTVSSETSLLGRVFLWLRNLWNT